MVKKNSIPERWRSLSSIGTRVAGSRFIAFKVPLKGATSQRVTQTQKFTPKDLITSIRNQNEELGMIIDLTNTERYYTTKDLPRSVQYVKLHTAGLKIPDDATIHQFKRVVQNFLFEHEENDKLIGVHCTTGINRTGYLICRYLIDVDAWRPLQTITAFAQSRGHAIEGAVYIEDLIKGPMRSNVGIDLPMTEEEKKELSAGTDEMSRDEPGNEFGDFDARDGRDKKPLPQMRPNVGLDDFDARDRSAAPQNILGDHDLRLPAHEPPRPMFPGRMRRPDFHPVLEALHDPTPRPLMSIPALGPRRFEEGDYDVRARGRPMHPMQARELSADMNYDGAPSRPIPPFARNKMINPAFEEEEEEAEQHEGELPYGDVHGGFPGSEGPRFHPRGKAMDGPFRGPPTRMQPRNARAMGGMNPRDSRLMEEETYGEGMQSQYMDESMYGSERMPQRNPRHMNALMDESEEGYMEDPSMGGSYMQDDMNEHAQELELPQKPMRPMQGMGKGRGQLMKGQLNERMHPNPAPYMGYPMSDRMNPREGQNMEGPSYDNMQDHTRSTAYQHLQNPRPSGGPMNARMPPRGPRPVENSMVDQGYPGASKAMDGSGNEHMYTMDSQASSMNNVMYPRIGSMSNQSYPRAARPADSTMNEWAPQGNARPANSAPLARKPRPVDGSVHENYPRSFETPNRFAPYPPKKPSEAQGFRGPPNMAPPARPVGMQGMGYQQNQFQ